MNSPKPEYGMDAWGRYYRMMAHALRYRQRAQETEAYVECLRRDLRQRTTAAFEFKDRAEKAEAQLARAQGALVVAAVPLEVLRAQIHEKPYAEMTLAFQHEVCAAALAVRAAALSASPDVRTVACRVLDEDEPIITALAASPDLDRARAPETGTTTCPVCGSPVTLHTSSEGTSHYTPARPEEAR